MRPATTTHLPDAADWALYQWVMHFGSGIYAADTLLGFTTPDERRHLFDRLTSAGCIISTGSGYHAIRGLA